MAVGPVRPALVHRKAVRERLAWLDPREADARDPVHVRRQNDAVPMNRGDLAQLIRDAEDRLAFTHADERPWDAIE